MSARVCRTVRRELPWFVGGDLPEARIDAVQEHLMVCVDCRRQAASLQQSTKALRAMAEQATSPTPAVAESMFASMHAEILGRVDEIAAASDRGPSPVWRSLLSIAAAAVLFVVGWWLVRSPSSLSVFERSPMVAPAAAGPATVVPWAGPRVELQLLGDEGPAAGGTGSPGPGMMGRWRLRTLVGEEGPERLLPGPESAAGGR